MPQRVHLEAAARRGIASAVALLDGPERPDALEYLYRWYAELARTRTAGLNGANPITYTDIEAWARLTGRAPTPQEVEGLLLLDLVTRHPEIIDDAVEDSAHD